MRLALTLFGTLLVALAVFEVLMQPSASERVELGLILGGMALLAFVTARLLPELARRLGSIRHTMALLAMAGFGVVVVGVLAVANRMFFSEHDLRLLLIVLGFGILATIIFAVGVSRPLGSDLDELSHRASLVAHGDLEPDVQVDRKDEVGRLADSLVMMIDKLKEAERARAADRESRRAFFSAVGHDLRTPLASLRASVEAMQDGVTEPWESLPTMEHDIEALTRLVDDLYLLARLDSGALEVDSCEIDVTEIADEAIDVLRPLSRTKGVALRLSATGRVKALGHPEHLGRVLRNLIENAVRHSPESGEVTVAVRRNNGSAVLTVTDQGPGFDSEFAPTAFERFTRADPSRVRNGSSGSGLGLAIVDGLVGAMNGHVWIAAGPGGHVGIELPNPGSASREDVAAS